jgi:hypothetical protein
MIAAATSREVMHEMAHVALRRPASPMTVTFDSRGRGKDIGIVGSTGPARKDLGPSH